VDVGLGLRFMPYNPQRRHSAINYNSPIKFELMHSMKKAA
jgi:transposase InsO family protein